MRTGDIYRYYFREDIQQAMLQVAKGREVAGVYKTGEFSKRPNTLVYPQDIKAMVKSGVVEFHSSIERWSNPMSIRPNNYEEIRSGWDIVLDLDCKDFEHGRIAAMVFCRGLEKHDIRNYSVKFTGGTGFHLGIPWNTIPGMIDYKESVGMFPDLARTIGQYIKEFVREDFEKALLRKFSPEKLASQLDKPLGSFFENGAFDPFKVVDVDPILISPRHLFRMPYSLNKKNWLVSLPLQPSDLDEFEKKYAMPHRVIPKMGFLDSGEENEAGLLISEAIDWNLKQAKKRKRRTTQRRELKGAVPREFFPDCINQILNGLSDGKKRSLFILITFLRSVGWDWTGIEEMVEEWNGKNTPPLRENYVRGQLRWHQQQDRKIRPPNCTGDGWYAQIGLRDPLSEKMKNPVNVAVRNFFDKQEPAPKQRKKK